MHRFTRGALAAVFALTATAGLASAQTPLLHWSFDEPSGPVLDSGAPPAANGELAGGASRSTNTPGGFGYSVDLRDDAATYAHVLGPAASKLNGLTQFTLTTWLNVSEYTSGNHRLAAQQDGGFNGGFSWNMNATPNDGTVGADNFRLALFIGNGMSYGAADFGAAYSSVDVDAADKWVFLAVTYNGSQATYYIGGTDSATTLLGTPQAMNPITLDSGAARFGVGYTHAAPTADTSVIGFQDDVRVYGTALSGTELEAIRLANIPEPTSIAAFGAMGLLALRRRRA